MALQATRTDESRSRLVDSWHYAYFRLLKVQDTESLMYTWGEKPPEWLAADLPSHLQLAESTLEEPDDVTRRALGNVIGVSAALLRNSLRLAKTTIDFHTAFYFALGIYTEREKTLGDSWADLTITVLYRRLEAKLEEIQGYVTTNLTSLVHTAADALVLSLILLARMKR